MRSLSVFIFFLYFFSSVCVFGMEQDPDEQRKNEERLRLIEKQKKERLIKFKHSASSPSFNGDPFKYVADNNYAKVKGLAILDPSLRKIKKNEEESLLLAAIKNLHSREKNGDKDQIKIAKAIIGLMLDPKNSSNLTEETIEIAKTFAKTNNMFAVIFALDSVISIAHMKITADRNLKELQRNPESYNEYKKIIFSDENKNEVRPRASSIASSTGYAKEQEGGLTLSEMLKQGPETTEEQKKDKQSLFEKFRKKPKKEKKEKIMVNPEEHKKKIFERLKLPWGESDKKKLALIAEQVQKNTNALIVKQENPPAPANSVKSSSSFSNSNPNLTIGLSHSADESPKSSSFEKYYGKPGSKKFDPNNNNNNQ